MLRVDRRAFLSVDKHALKLCPLSQASYLLHHIPAGQQVSMDPAGYTTSNTTGGSVPFFEKHSPRQMVQNFNLRAGLQLISQTLLGEVKQDHVLHTYSGTCTPF